MENRPEVCTTMADRTTLLEVHIREMDINFERLCVLRNRLDDLCRRTLGASPMDAPVPEEVSVDTSNLKGKLEATAVCYGHALRDIESLTDALNEFA